MFILITVKSADDRHAHILVGEEFILDVKLCITGHCAAAFNQSYSICSLQILKVICRSRIEQIIIPVDQASIIGEIFTAHDDVKCFNRHLPFVFNQWIMRHIPWIRFKGYVCARREFLYIISAIRMASPEKLIIAHRIEFVFIDHTHKAAHEIILHICLVF